MSKRLFKTLVAVLAIAAAAAGPARAQSITCSADDLGKVICTDGSIYATVSAATTAGKTAAAMIAYVDETNLNGLALALADESSYMDWSTANGASGAAAHTPTVTGQAWKLPSVAEYKLMLKAFGGNEDSYTGLNTAVTNAGGTPFQLNEGYWTSTEHSSASGKGTEMEFIDFNDSKFVDWSGSIYASDHFIRACFSFSVVLTPKYTVTFAEGTEDVDNWSITPAEATNTGVTAGTVVTVKYNGTSRINSIELKSKMLTTPLTIEAITDGTVVVENPRSGMQYSKNGGAKTAVTSAAITVDAGDKVAFYGNGTSITNYVGTGIGGGYLGTAEVKVYGNIMSLVNETGFDTATTLTANNAFSSLFGSYINLKDISGLKLPATTLTQSCYESMFSYCAGLTTVPSDLLPATTLAENCYAGMFGGCENLTNVPTLPATTLAEGCYSNMFYGCAALTTAPALPATTLVARCYSFMFASCYNLSSVTCLATSGIGLNSSTDNWLSNAGSNVTGTKTFNAASMVNWPDGASGIPNGWTLVTPAHTPLTMEALTDGTIKVQSPQSGMQYTLNGGTKTAVTSAAIDVVAGDKVVFYGNGTSITSYDGTTIAGGTADVKVYGNIMSLVNETGFATATTLSVQNQFNNLFEENNHLKDASGLLLPATTLAPTCYAYMFHYCRSLTAAPAVLPATTLASNCYRGMFLDCSSLTTAPVLPAQTLVSECYSHMFQLCTKLNSVTCLATSGINQNGSTESWLDNAGTDQSVTTKTFNAASSAEWPTSVHGIPEGWTLGAQSTPEPVTLVPTGNTNEWTLTMPADNMLLMLNYVPASSLHTVRFADGNNGWQVQDVTAATSAVAPAVLENVIAGDSLVATYNGTKKVKSVKAVKYVPPVLVQSIVLNKTLDTVAVGSTKTLSVTSVLPENATDPTYTWSSDNITKATVNQNGVVTGVAAGTANIIATANDGSGVADTCVVTVLNSVILDGVTVLFASNNDNWETVIDYNPGVLNLDGGKVRLTSNGAILFHHGYPVGVDNSFELPLLNEYQWLLVTNINGAYFYYRQGETWQQAIDAGRMFNHNWSIESGQVIYDGEYILVDNNSEPVNPLATIDPSTVNYHLGILH